MIKIAIKHFIYEKCIDTLFNAILLNFSVIKKNGTENLHPYFIHLYNMGSTYAPNSLEYVNYKDIFIEHTYRAKSGWIVYSDAIDDLVLYGCKLNALMKQNPTYTRLYGPFD